MKNEVGSLSASFLPCNYEFWVEGQLDPIWLQTFDSLEIEVHSNQTRLHGILADQSAVHGVLKKIRDLGLTLIAVNRLN